MQYMRNLQHLNISRCHRLMYLPVGILKGVTGVRLTDFPVGEMEKGAQIGELGDLNLLEDELEIRGLENVGGLTEANNANLKSKTNLLTLRLKWQRSYLRRINLDMFADDEEVLEGLEPIPTLRELAIHNCTGTNLSPGWIVNLKNLVQIEFVACTTCEQIPPLGKLPSLRVIKLYKMYSLKCFHEEDNTTKSGDNNTSLFPSLQELDINECHNLISLPSNFPNLKKLYIDSCNSLLSLPDEIRSSKHLEKLVIYGCENLSRSDLPVKSDDDA